MDVSFLVSEEQCLIYQSWLPVFHILPHFLLAFTVRKIENMMSFKRNLIGMLTNGFGKQNSVLEARNQALWLFGHCSR